MESFKKNILLIFISAGIFFLNGCMSRPNEDSIKLTIDIKTNQLTNKGKYFYALVKVENEQKYSSSNYESVYNSFLDNETTLKKIYIMPENTITSTSMWVNHGDSASIYFLFSNANFKSWKYRINKLETDQRFTFELGEESILNVKSK